MKLILFIFCLLLLPYGEGTCAHAGMSGKYSSSLCAPDEVDQELESIRKKRSRINSSKIKIKTLIIGESECVDQGTVRYYSENNRIVKIQLSFSSIGSRYTTRFYFKEGSLIYIDDLSETVQNGTNSIVKRGYYIRKDALIKQVENNRTVKTDDSSEELIVWSNRLVQAWASGDIKGLLCDI